MKYNTLLNASLVVFVFLLIGETQAGGIKMLFGGQDLAGSAGGGGGSGVPIDGGLSTMIVGSALYGYRMMKKRENK